MKSVNWHQLEEDLKGFVEMADSISEDYFGLDVEAIHKNVKSSEECRAVLEQKQATYVELLRVLFPIAVENNVLKPKER
ncbi:MAG: hypothetical protein WC325_09480 [Candidatus Bathyarchaeia archaeon]|jgi:hypothetical protein